MKISGNTEPAPFAVEFTKKQGITKIVGGDTMSKSLTDMVSPAKQLKEFDLNKSPLLESIGKHNSTL